MTMNLRRVYHYLKPGSNGKAVCGAEWRFYHPDSNRADCKKCVMILDRIELNKKAREYDWRRVIFSNDES